VQKSATSGEAGKGKEHRGEHRGNLLLDQSDCMIESVMAIDRAVYLLLAALDLHESAMENE
jgi:hypothetical protein